MQTLIQRALEEDAAFNDVTSRATIPEVARAEARITAKQAGIISGCEVATAVFQALSAEIRCQWLKSDADAVEPNEEVCRLEGPLRPLLAGERTALNFLQHLSGIATATRAFVRAVDGTGCLVVDTRKTTPGLRRLEKQAVVHGGGVNHRMSLADAVLIKENHILAAGSITEAIRACRRQAATLPIEVECETLDEVRQAVAAGPDIILLDNMSLEDMHKARRLVPPDIILEASGNITLERARAVAETGVDRIAVGAITHSAPALDLSLRVNQ